MCGGVLCWSLLVCGGRLRLVEERSEASEERRNGEKQVLDSDGEAGVEAAGFEISAVARVVLMGDRVEVEVRVLLRRRDMVGMRPTLPVLPCAMWVVLTEPEREAFDSGLDLMMEDEDDSGGVGYNPCSWPSDSDLHRLSMVGESGAAVVSTCDEGSVGGVGGDVGDAEVECSEFPAMTDHGGRVVCVGEWQACVCVGGKKRKEVRTCAKKLEICGRRLSMRSGLGVAVPPGGVLAPEPMWSESSAFASCGFLVPKRSARPISAVHWSQRGRCAGSAGLVE